MFPTYLFEKCKCFIKFDTSVKPTRLYCKAFPNGNGIPSDYKCVLVTDYNVFDGKAVPPSECPNGCSFESKYPFVDPRVQAEIDRKNGLNFPDE